MTFQSVLLSELAGRLNQPPPGSVWLIEIAQAAVIVAAAYRQVADITDRDESKRAIAALTEAVQELERTCLRIADFQSRLNAIVSDPANASLKQ